MGDYCVHQQMPIFWLPTLFNVRLTYFSQINVQREHLHQVKHGYLIVISIIYIDNQTSQYTSHASNFCPVNTKSHITAIGTSG